jgi:2-polyprenyl-3-methyl-5-hydroxy-6-metoxy-1,4-benzoquinol methylase
MDFNTIDWNALWEEAADHSNWDTRSQKDLWDQRAGSFSKRISRVADDREQLDKDDYISKMLERIEIKPEWSVLDIGCGPGTLTIPLARKVKSITALDISSEMLKHLKINADINKLNNINYLVSSWQDAFTENKLGEYDVVIASRSLMSLDMKGAISNINFITRHVAYITFPVIHLPLDFEVYRAIGRNGKKHAPYI